MDSGDHFPTLSSTHFSPSHHRQSLKKSQKVSKKHHSRGHRSTVGDNSSDSSVWGSKPRLGTSLISKKCSLHPNVFLFCIIRMVQSNPSMSNPSMDWTWIKSKGQHHLCQCAQNNCQKNQHHCLTHSQHAHIDQTSLSHQVDSR